MASRVVLPILFLAISLSSSNHATALSFAKARSLMTPRELCISKPRLVCVFSPTATNSAAGTVIFRPIFRSYQSGRNRCLVRIVGNLNGLSEGLHGFHIHSYGDLRSTDGTSTGGHFSNPQMKPTAHGLPNDRVRHWGDFGSATADSQGVVAYRRTDRVVSLEGIVGRGMIVHALEDLGSDAQPSGGAGSRQAQCVIGYANPDI